ncbi:MAG: energy-coupling factor transporter transmembrane protein EcfT [Kyrpidia tusciae]|nr:energy-coupling factor transporter transmembrane component T [Kyrpidia tusciae]MBE3553264.1 energy-coupling factor transporter transmembrane protein EcfT [Kyrpidia tusciae]
MKTELLLGQYLPRQTFLHRLDPRSKLLIALLFTIDLMKAQWPWEVLGFGALAVLGMGIARVPLRSALRTLSPILFLIAFSAVMNLTAPGPRWIEAGPVTLTRTGLVLALDTLTRIPALILLASLLVWTTSPAALADGLASSLHPMEKWGRPGRAAASGLRDLIFFAGLALRLIPQVHQSFRRVKMSFLARGLEVDTGPARVRWRYLAEMIVPWLVAILRSADDISLALTARGYRRGAAPTPLYIQPWSRREILSVAAAGLVTLWVWRHAFVSLLGIAALPF